MGFDYSENSDGSGGVHEEIMKYRRKERIRTIVLLIIAAIGIIGIAVGFLLGVLKGE